MRYLKTTACTYVFKTVGSLTPTQILRNSTIFMYLGISVGTDIKITYVLEILIARISCLVLMPETACVETAECDLLLEAVSP